MKLISLFLPRSWIQQLDALVEARIYPNRAEAIRLAVRDLLQSQELEYFRTLRKALLVQPNVNLIREGSDAQADL